ncbi:MAG TPA: nuclear transport factor 2 family protein [Acidobacteriota bacterium]|nr:nuclear transport factor 2 family protein [Acidobacteriota bacterium]
MAVKKAALAIFALMLVEGTFVMSESTRFSEEKAKVEKAINDCIMWPYPEKNIDRLYNAVAKDSSFVIFHPDSASTIIGYDAFQRMIDDVFLKDELKATGTDIRDLRINLSQSGDAAWYSCILDDTGEWAGRPYRWLNTRWTGVLEKRDGTWLIVQMHFSFASDAQDESDEQVSDKDKKDE